MQTKNKKRISPIVLSTLASILIIIGGFFILNNYIMSKKVIAYDYMANIFYQESIKENKEVKEEKEEIKQQEQPKEEVKKEENIITYIGYLNIPKIGLNKGFYDINNSENDVEKNLYVAPNSNYPDTKNSNLIIAAHSGTGWKAFFNDLYKLEKNDTLYITYKNKKYTYKIDKIYKQNKTGKIAIYRDYEKTTLTLVTCTNNDSTTQTIYISYLINEENI